MQLYNDYNYKDISKSFKIILENKSDVIKTPWEASYESIQLSTIFYKLDLFSSIEQALKNGLNPSDIFILDGNFITQNDIKKLNSKDIFTAYNELNNIGLITTLLPNNFHMSLSLIFSFKKDIIKLSRSYNFNPFSQEDFKDIILNHLNNSNLSFKEIIDVLSNKILNKIEKFKNKNVLLNKFNKLKKYYLSEIEKIENFIRSKKKKDIEKALLKNEKININYKRYYNDFYEKFFILFLTLDKPIVGVLYNNSLKFDIFSKHSILYSKDFENAFIDLYYMSHNSPWQRKFKLSLALIITLYLATDRIINSWKTIEEISKIQLEKESIKLDIIGKKQKLNNAILKKNSKIIKKFNEDIKNKLMDYNISIEKQIKI